MHGRERLYLDEFSLRSDLQLQAYQGWINCALQHCWNKVVTCEYQNLALNAVRYCPLTFAGNNSFAGSTNWAFIPYFPSDPTLPGACSCNIAKVWLSQYHGETEAESCDDIRGKQAYTCDCCEMSKDVSSFYDICPDTDPSAVLPYMRAFPYARLASSAPCNSLLPTIDCDDYDFALPNVTTGAAWYNGENLPQNGTAPLSDKPGDITSPVYPTITWSLGNGAQVQTAIAVTTGSPAGGSGGGGSPGATPSGSKAAAATAAWNGRLAVGVSVALLARAMA